MPILVEDTVAAGADFIRRYWPAAVGAAGKYAPAAKEKAGGFARDLTTVGLGSAGVGGLMLAATPPRAPKTNPLLKTASARWVKELGGLSDEAVELLKRRGVPRSLEQIVDGMNEGTENILARSNASFAPSGPTAKALSGGGYATETELPLPSSYGNEPRSVIRTMDPDNPVQRFKSPLHTTFSGKDTRSLRDALGKRHEAYEAAAANNGQVMQGLVVRRPSEKTRAGADFIAGKLHSRKAKTLANILHEAKRPVGTHNSLNVLGREANDVQRLDRVYPGTSRFVKTRKSTGESGLLERLTGKQYGKDQFSSKDLSRLTKAKGTPVRIGLFGNNEGTEHVV